MGFTTKLILNTTRIKNDGTFPLVIRITYYRNILKLSLGYCLTEKDWNAKIQQIRTTSKVSSNITRLNNILKNKQALVYNQVSELEMTGVLKKLSPKQLKAVLTQSEEESKMTVYNYIDQLIAEKLTAGKKGTALTYRGIKRKLIAVFGNRLTYFEQLDYKALKDIETYHLAKGGGKGGLSVNLRALRAIYNRAIKEKIVGSDNYPFKDYIIQSSDTQRQALSEADFLKFKSLPLEHPLLQGQDYFMTSFYLRGMNFIDMAYLQGSNIDGDFERIKYKRNKTGKYFSIKISEPLKDILQKYIENPNNKDAYIFPILEQGMSTERQYETIKNKRKRLNQKLKKIASLNNLDPFTIYVARHTYATMGKRRGVPTAVIQESLGHKTELITQTYLNSFDNSVVDEYDELIMS